MRKNRTLGLRPHYLQRRLMSLVAALMLCTFFFPSSVRADSTDIDLILLIDNSGSMQGIQCPLPGKAITPTDPEDLRIWMSRFMVGYLKATQQTNQSRVGIAAFGGIKGLEVRPYSSLDWPSQAIRESIKKEMLCDTEFIPALDWAYEEFKKNNSFSGNRQPVVVLLTDAELNEYPRPLEGPKYLSDEDYLVQLEKRMNRLRTGLARPTKFYAVTINATPKDAMIWQKRLLKAPYDTYRQLDFSKQLIEGFHTITTEILGYPPSSAAIRLGSNQVQKKALPPYIRQAVFSFFKSSPNVQIEIRRPNGEILAPSDSDVKYFGGGAGDRDEFYVVTRPTPGDWRVITSGGAGEVELWLDQLPLRLQLEDANVVRSADRPLELRVIVADVDRGGAPAQLSSKYAMQVTGILTNTKNVERRANTTNPIKPNEGTYLLQFDTPFDVGEHILALMAEWKDPDSGLQSPLIPLSGEPPITSTILLARYPTLNSVDLARTTISQDEPISVTVRTRGGQATDTLRVTARARDTSRAVIQEATLRRVGPDIFSGEIRGLSRGAYEIIASLDGEVAIPTMSGDRRLVPFGPQEVAAAQSLSIFGSFPTLAGLTLSPEVIPPDQKGRVAVQLVSKEPPLAGTTVTAIVTGRGGAYRKEAPLGLEPDGRYAGEIGPFPYDDQPYTLTAVARGQIALPAMPGLAAKGIPFGQDTGASTAISFYTSQSFARLRLGKPEIVPAHADEKTPVKARVRIENWEHIEDLRVSMLVMNADGDVVSRVPMTATGASRFEGNLGVFDRGTYTVSVEATGLVATRNQLGIEARYPIEPDISSYTPVSVAVGQWWFDKWQPWVLIIGGALGFILLGFAVKKIFFPTPYVAGMLEILEPASQQGRKYHLVDFNKREVTVGASGDIALDTASLEGAAQLQPVEARFVGQREGRDTQLPPRVFSVRPDRPVIVDNDPVSTTSGFALPDDGQSHEIVIGDYRFRYRY